MRRHLRDVPVARDPILQEERRALLGRLVGGAIHELNNPLSVLLGQVTLLRRAVGTEAPLAARAEKLGEAADRCARIVRNFVALQGPPEQPGPVDLDRLVRETLELLAHGLRSRNISVKFVAGAPNPAWADARSLRELLAHLIVSVEAALETAPAPRSVEVRTSLSAKPQTLELRVIVTAGAGFDPRASGQAELAALGVSHALAEAVGGQFEVDDDAAETTRVVSIPAAGSIPATAGPAASKKILIVPGREEFAAFVADVLSASGHLCTLSAQDSPNAEQRSAFDAVVLDADQTGLDIVSWVGEEPKGLVVLAGEALPSHVGSLLHKAGVQVVRKPVDPEELLAAVGRSLR